jgi:hypothetical protein
MIGFRKKKKKKIKISFDKKKNSREYLLVSNHKTRSCLSPRVAAMRLTLGKGSQAEGLGLVKNLRVGQATHSAIESFINNILNIKFKMRQYK